MRSFLLKNNFYNSFDRFLFNKKRGSLLLIFMFTTGLLAILVTGLYFVVTASTLQQSATEQQAARNKVERGLEQIHKSELSRLIKDYISNLPYWYEDYGDTGLYQGNVFRQTLVSDFDSTSYRTAIASATNWAFNTGTLKEAAAGNPGSLSVSMPDIDTYPPFTKTNPISANTNFRQHPLSFARGYDAVGTLSGTFTPTWSDKSFSYSRSFVGWREIPVVHIPLLLSASGSSGISRLQSTTLTGGPVVLLKGDTSHANAAVASTVSAVASAPNLPEMTSSFGCDPSSTTDPTFADLDQAGQQRQGYYQLDGSSVIVFTFNGTTITNAPLSSHTLPTAPNDAFTVGTFDQRDRAIIDLAKLPTTGSYANKKWFIFCSSTAAKVRGIVIKDNGNNTGAAASVSIATNGHVYLWQYKRSDKTPVMVANSFGGVGLADANYSGTTASAPLDFSWRGGISAHAKDWGDYWYDNFGRVGTLPGSAPTYVWHLFENAGTWSSTRTGGGTLNVNTGALTASAANTWCLLTHQNDTIYSAMYGVYITTTGFSSGKYLRWMFTNSTVYDDASAAAAGARLDLNVTHNGSGTVTANVNQRTTAGVTTQYATTTASYSAGTNVWGFFYSAPTNQAFITLNGTVILATKVTATITGLTTAPLLTQGVLKMDDSITITQIKKARNPFGTHFSSPQTAVSGTDSAIFYGGVGVGTGFGSSLDSGATVNFQYQSAVGTALENFCERVLVHYPYLYKP